MIPVSKVLSIGEILWDIFPDSKVWGGAPVNFAFHARQFGAMSSCFSAVGNDKAGRELKQKIREVGINLNAPAVDYPTGAVNIQLDQQGHPTYNFLSDCAWDHIPLSQDLLETGKQADLLYFGTLAQRHESSRHTIMELLENRKSSAKVLLDVNLRQNFYSKEILEKSLAISDFLKINDEEEKVLTSLLGKTLQDLLQAFNLEVIILTKGEKGSRIITEKAETFLKAPKCRVIDTVGAGDAYTACFIINYLRGAGINLAQQKATIAASYICEQQGATATIPDHLKHNLIINDD